MSAKPTARKLAYYAGDRVGFQGNLYRVCMDEIDAVLGHHATIKDYLEEHTNHYATLVNNGRFLMYGGLMWFKEDEPSYVNRGAKPAKAKKSMMKELDASEYVPKKTAHVAESIKVVEHSVAPLISHEPVHEDTIDLAEEEFEEDEELDEPEEDGFDELEQCPMQESCVPQVVPATQATQPPVQEVREITYKEVEFNSDLLCASGDVLVFTIGDAIPIDSRNIDISLDKANIRSTNDDPIMIVMYTETGCKKLGGFARITTYEDIVVKDGIFKINYGEFDICPHGKTSPMSTQAAYIE